MGSRENPVGPPGSGHGSSGVPASPGRPALERPEALLSRVERVAQLGFWEWDRHSGAVVWSHGVFRIFGCTPGKFTPSREGFIDAIHPEDRSRMVAILDDVVRTAEPYSHAYRIVQPGGVVRWVQSEGEAVLDDAGAVAGMFGTIQDITAYHEVTERLAASERRFRQLAESLPAAIAHVDADLRYRFVNHGWEHWIGQRGDKVLGRWAGDVLDSELYTRLQPYLDRALAGEEVAFELTAAFPGAGRRHVRMHYVPDVDDDGVNGVFVLGTDLTEQKRTEEALRQQTHKLGELDRRKDEFLAMLGHELRNPLVPIRYTAEALMTGGPPGGHVAASARVIAEQTDHLTALVDDLLDVTRIAHGRIRLRPEPLDLREIVTKAAEATTAMAEARGQRLTLSTAPRPVRVEGDPVRLLQIVENLLVNAVKYTGESGCITAAVGEDGGDARIRVTDTGFGIPEDLLSRIFEPFSQGVGDRTQEGLGLGLYLARVLAESHGGTIQASSGGAGRGSAFTVRMPLGEPAPDPVPATDAAPATSAQGPLPACRVLIVEDNAAVAESMLALLESLGHEAHAAADGAAAVAAMDRVAPAVAFVDIGLPDMDGRDVARRLRERDRGAALVLVALTGHGHLSGDFGGGEGVFDRCLTKPARSADLREIVRDAAVKQHQAADRSGR